MKISSIDLGTNSFLCLISEVEGTLPSTTIRPIEDVSRVVRLGEKVHQNRRFLPEALKRAELCLDEFEKIIGRYKVDRVVATATSAARDAENGQDLLELGRKRGIPISIIEGGREAELSFVGAVSSLKDGKEKKVLVVDVGGGSTELIFREPGKTIQGKSFDVGCVRLTEMFLKKDPVDEVEFSDLFQFARKTIEKYHKVNPDVVLAVAGTPTTLACIDQHSEYTEKKVEGYVLTQERIRQLTSELGALPLEVRKKKVGLDPLRADVIIAGGAILDCVLSLVGKGSLQVSTRGLRYGVALHHEEF